MGVIRPGLVISRRVDESFAIFVDRTRIDVFLNAVNRSKASLRIVAPDHVDILRTELLNKEKE
jgi:sRNA-binding carbon storage regulator CsrA